MQEPADIINLDQIHEPAVRLETGNIFAARVTDRMVQETFPPGEGMMLTQNRDNIIDSTTQKVFYAIQFYPGVDFLQIGGPGYPTFEAMTNCLFSQHLSKIYQCDSGH